MLEVIKAIFRPLCGVLHDVEHYIRLSFALQVFDVLTRSAATTALQKIRS